jgi:dTDP-4-amino-4,6-dideoxygalactose transaminase
MKKIPIAKPLFGKEEMEIIQKPLKTGWVVQGPFVEEFEEKFTTFTNAKHAVATTSCTTALHIAVCALGLKPGDEVIMPAFTWISTANVVEYLGAKPVFCDIDLSTYNIDVTQIEQKITERTAGIIPVHLFGLSADMNPVLDIARRKKLWVLEDAACGFGAFYHGKHTGTMGTMGCFSFHPRKSITTGEGGIITTESAELDKIARSLRDHGASKTDFERQGQRSAFLLSDYKQIGFNFRMTDIQGALGSVQMDRAQFILDAKTKLARTYDRKLSKLDWLRPPQVPNGYTHGYQAYVTLFAPEEPSLKNVKELNKQRNELMQKMEERGISTRQGTHAVVTQEIYKEKYGFLPSSFPNSVIAEALSLALPLYAQLEEDEAETVVSALTEFGP